MALYGSDLRIDDAGLTVYGENVAKLMRPAGKTRTKEIGTLVRRELEVLRRRHEKFSVLYGADQPAPAVAEWLLDNFFLAQGEAIKTIGELKNSLFLASEKGVSALFWLCRCLVRSGEGRITEERIRLFFEGCQKVYVLNTSEISLLVPMLRATLISELADLYGDGTLTDAATSPASRLFGSLRLASTLDFSELLEAIDKVEQLYRKDPAGVYPLMSERTRAHYKSLTARLAKRRRVGELRVAERVLYLSRNARGDERHIGHWLYRCPLGAARRERRGLIYTLVFTLLTLLVCAGFGLAFSSVALAFFLLLPASEAIKFLLDLLLLRIFPPTHLPRLELKDGVPPEGRCICVISALLTSEKSGGKLARRLEEYSLANRRGNENLLFGILGDLPDSTFEHDEKDELIINSAKIAVNALNVKYGGGFFLLMRGREKNVRDKKYMAHERKRGAICELVRLIEGEQSCLHCVSGSTLSLRGVRYILTLDEDTRLTPDSAISFIGAMLHPLNKPVIDSKKRLVCAGHGIIQPRMSTELSSMNKSDFSRIFAGQGGSDPYGCDCGEVYMDCFQNGGFAGKGIIDTRAFSTCMEGRIPENLVLSHDALEGAFLRGGLMSDIELLDSHPADILAFFKRMERWTRGDWQNISWLFFRGRGLKAIDRFRLFDSLRRSLLAPWCFAAFLAAFFSTDGAFIIAGIAALVSLSLRVFQALFQELFARVDSARLRLRSHLIRGICSTLLQFFLRLILLPHEAYVCTGAILTALWRMGVSHLSMLNWTPASVFDSRKQGAAKYFGSMWFCLLSALTLLLFSSSAVGITAGFVWLFSPALALELSREKKPAKCELSEADRRYLLGCAAKMWAYFEELCSAEEHFLPPDNFQEKPPVGIAHRTSPTNIGLCLVSALSAIELGLTRPEVALGVVENVLATMRRLVKWEGHLYNWYDTRTLKPLHPSYVSTVDSGNLAVCLLILREGLLELGQTRLSEEAGRLAAAMRFAPLYDKRRRLFSIGVDLETGEKSRSYYDLFASEARSASFLAIATGEISRKHWEALSRAQVQNGFRRGCVSWSGTMFEYLMPRLFFASEKGSLIYETEHFSTAVQRGATRKKDVPWGISESAYYTLDPSLSYKYKAHGCAALALKRGMEREIVISPYSSFLALSCGAKSVLQNLRRLEQLMPQGRFGFWDALDFSPDRTGEDGEAVRCVMAHHVGMSLVAIANCLCDDVMPKRLSRIPELAAHTCLLEEKVPLQGTPLRRHEIKSPEKPPRHAEIYWERRGRFVDWRAPACGVLSNGAYDIMLTDSAITSASWRGISPYLTPRETPAFSHGFDMWLEQEGHLVSILPEAKDDEKTKNHWKFTLSDANYISEQRDFTAETKIQVASCANGEKRQITVSPIENAQTKSRLVVGFTPMLAAYCNYVNHPAFFRLGISAYEREGTLILHRRARPNERDYFLCLAASAPMEFSARREKLPARCESGLPYEFSASPLGDLSDPYICAAMPLHIGGEKKIPLTIALAVGSGEQEAFDGAQRILMEPDVSVGNFISSVARSFSLNEARLCTALDLLPTLNYPAPIKSSLPLRELWRFGISGDLPLISREIDSAENLSAAADLMVAHRLLGAVNQKFDLCFITMEGGDYMRPLAAALENLRRNFGGGTESIHIIDSSQHPEALLELSAKPRKRSPVSPDIRYLMPTPSIPKLGASPTFRYLNDDSFQFDVTQNLPPRAWGNILTNGHFSFFATDCGTGHMWFENAREYHINRWLNDPLTTYGTERLCMDGSSLFASACETAKVTFGHGFARWEKDFSDISVTTHAFVDKRINARVLIVTWEGEAAELSWYTDLVLGGDPSHGHGISLEECDGFITARSTESPFPDFPFTVCANAPINRLITEREKFLRIDELAESEGVDCIGLEFTASSPFVLVCGCDTPEAIAELLDYSSAMEALTRTKRGWKEKVSQIKIETPLPALDRLVNGWLPYQTIACRLMGRSSIYQSGGATGFRDQLQDAVNLILLDSNLSRQQIITCCRHQYIEGDVMHWWHILQTQSRGVRTRCSDDLLWLPWALCEYVEKTGDYSLCEIPVPWLCSPTLEENEHDRYETALWSDISDSVLEHCKKAFDCVTSRGVGEHGLLKIGGGDWNDGMDAVGRNGHGESVWLSWFYSNIAHRFAGILRKLGHETTANELESASKTAGENADAAWDGDRYLRGYFDDGTPLGSAWQDCCRIDSIVQSFACLSLFSDSWKVSTALSSAVSLLFDRENGIIRLFDPPFESSKPCPGYIESYGPGFRENGGQYTHAAVWLVMALLREERIDEAFELIEALIPELKDSNIYGAEPFVIAADISSNPDNIGLAGWSWYTGAAGWLWRVLTEELFGLRLENGKMTANPRLPALWRKREVSVSFDGDLIWKNDVESG